MEVGKDFVLLAIQDWGQPEIQRMAAVQAVLTAAGFKAQATCGPVFGSIWPKPCAGPQATVATEWLKDLTATMPRGRFETEVEHVEAAIAARKAPAP